ncbi:MAG: integrase, partial [Candidatus Omnitrophica bacterium]|nr:integrase [Candidatus Omnitrophota bacterium]
QKNWTHIRQWLGYIRLDNPDVVPLMNDLYTSEWRLYHNFFCPSVKLISKKRIASKTVKRYDKPKTPYRRVLESKHVPASVKRNLKEQIKGLNPFQLKRAMEKKLKKIFSVNRKNALYI